MFRFLVFSAIVACAFGNSILPRFSSPAGRIVGGHKTTIEKHPYQVSVRDLGKHKCGGSILDSRKVLTACHCFMYLWSDVGLTIQYGITKRGTNDNVISVAEVKRHPEFNTNRNVNNDVCVLLLDKDIPFSDKARPIQLAKEVPSEGTKVVVTGWGYLKETPTWINGKLANILQEVELEIVDREACARKLVNSTGHTLIDNTMVCAGFRGGGKDSCTYDSGGPLVYDEKLVGVVSWGQGCGKPGVPGVYANVAGLRDWILEQ